MRRLLQFVARDPDPVLWGNEPIYRDDQIVGYTTSAAYGHTLGGSVAMGYVSDPDQSYKGDWCDGKYEVENNGERLIVKPYLRSAYDPDRVRIMG